MQSNVDIFMRLNGLKVLIFQHNPALRVHDSGIQESRRPVDTKAYLNIGMSPGKHFITRSDRVYWRVQLRSYVRRTTA